MSDTVIISLVTGVVSLIGTCFIAWMSYLVARLNKITAEQARKVEAVRTDLEHSNQFTIKKLDDIKVVADTTHSLVNSAAIKMARLYAASCRLNANLTKDAGYIRIAEEAEKALAVMEASQERIDSKNASAKQLS